MSKFFILIAALIFTAACATRPAADSTNGSKTTESGTSAEKVASDSIHPRGIDFQHAPEKIAFGSCANQDAPQPLWKTIVGEQPDLFLFMGDNVYASRPEQQPIGEQYKKLSKIPEYREAREKIPFMAIWDDHDLGTNDGGMDAPTKAVARKEFLSYWAYVKDSLVPQNRDGLYHTKTIGGQVTGKRRKRVNGPIVQVIMLDTRSFRSPLKLANDPSNPLHKFDPTDDKSATLLGSAQWEWLEEQLRKPAELRIIVSSIQLVATQHGFEKWANFPQERERFFNLLRKTNAKNVVVFSGDRHLGVISKQDIKGWGTLYDITASSINKPGDLQENDPAYIAPVFNPENFGLASIDWKNRRLKVELKDITGKTVQQADLKLR